MTDFIEQYYRETPLSSEGFESQRAKRKAFSIILPVLMENELTKQQSICLKYKYIHGKSQREIAQTLKLSQPTVSRHIAVGKRIINNNLAYCWAAMTAALREYERLN